LVEVFYIDCHYPKTKAVLESISDRPVPVAKIQTGSISAEENISRFDIQLAICYFFMKNIFGTSG
jgi:hypothetical protein